MHSNSVGSGSIATLAHLGTSIACLATQEPWVIDSGATNHMTSTSGLLFDLEHSSNLPNVTLADGSTTTGFGLGATNLSLNLSLSFVIYILDFPFNLLLISKLYYLDRRGSSSLVASHLSISPLQNHCRLGHPSIKNLKLVLSCHQLSHYNVKHVNWVNTKGCLFSLGVRLY